MTPESFMELAARASVQVTISPTGQIHLSGPEHDTRKLAFDAKGMKAELLDHLSRLSRPVPLDRDRKNRVKTKPVPLVPPVPVKIDTDEAVPVVPKTTTELKSSCFYIDTCSVYEYRLTDKPNTWLIMLAPGCNQAEAKRALELKFGADRLLSVRVCLENRRDKRDKRDSHCFIKSFPVPMAGQVAGQTGTDRDSRDRTEEKAA